jgi:hypothetical protein
VDATGLAQGAVSTFFVRRMHHHGQKPLPWRHWLKWAVAVDLDQQFVLSQLARRGPWNDCANLPAVVAAASEQTRIGLVLADAEFDRLSARAPGRSLRTQMRQALLLGLSFNLYRLKHRRLFLRMSTEP